MTLQKDDCENDKYFVFTNCGNHKTQPFEAFTALQKLQTLQFTVRNSLDLRLSLLCRKRHSKCSFQGNIINVVTNNLYRQT